MSEPALEQCEYGAEADMERLITKPDTSPAKSAIVVFLKAGETRNEESGRGINKGKRRGLV
jgi:hypothetical protein